MLYYAILCSTTAKQQYYKITSANIHCNACNNDAIHAIQQNNNATINTKYDKGTILHCVQQLIIIETRAHELSGYQPIATHED